jgi:sugar phosphate isomerase/epimerase
VQLSLFSISYAGLWGQASLDLRQFLRKAASLGFDSVMLAGKRPHLSPLDADESLVASLRTDLKELGLACPVMAAYTDFGSKVAGEVPFAEMQIAYVQSLCRIGAQLGSKYVRIFTAYESPAEANAAALWKQSVAIIREMCDRAKDHGLTIAIQNHHDLAVHTEVLLEFLADIDRDNCKLGFDAWSPALRGEDLYASAKMAAPYTAITTNADYVKLPRFRYRPELTNYERAMPDLVRAVEFGRGFIDYKAFFAGLRDGGFDGVATYEMCSPLRGGGSESNLDQCATAYLAWMKQNASAQ